MTTHDREMLRAKQDKVVAICKDREFAKDIPISGLQFGCPTWIEIQSQLYPDFEPSMDSFLSEFDKD